MQEAIQVLLVEDVAGLGKFGQLAKVKPGYARNFLIPQGKAKRATRTNLAEFEARRAELETQQAEKLASAQQRATALQDLSLTVTQRAGVDGRLFGSVTAQDIVTSLNTAGHTVVKSEIHLPDGPFKKIGEYTVKVTLHHDVTATVQIQVVAAA